LDGGRAPIFTFAFVHFPFDQLLPNAADGLMRQALVHCWMMLPRAGGRTFADVKPIVSEIYFRNIAIWEKDPLIFTKSPGRKARKPKPRKTVSWFNKKPVRKK
jgi:hypothetical protein